MAEELRLAIILLGSLAIGAVVLHGIWTVRKNVNEERKLEAQEQENDSDNNEEEDIDAQALKIKQMEMDFSTIESESGHVGSLPVVDVNMDSIYTSQESKVAQSQNSMFEESHSEAQVSETLELPKNDIQDTSLPSFSALDVVDTVATSDAQTPVGFSKEESDKRANERRCEAGLNERRAFETDFEGQGTQHQRQPQAQVETKSQPDRKAEAKSEVLILYVDKSEGEMIDGAKLLPILLTLGFKFGEMDFFHRHENSSGHGEILFSLANMYNPGKFDIDHMEQVSTRGLSIFMTLPNAGEALQTFNMMHNAAKKIADEFGARVLDSQRQPLDVLRVRHYVDKIRKF